MRLSTRSKRRFAATRRPYEGGDRAVGQRQIDVAQRLHRTVEKIRACGSRSWAAPRRRARARRADSGTRVFKCCGSFDDGIIVSDRPAPRLQQSEQYPCRDAQNQDGHRDDQSARPGEILPVLVRTQGELKDDHRQIRHGSIQIAAPELIVERGEQQRCRLAADARHGQQQSRDDAAARRRIEDAQGGAPWVSAQGGRGILHTRQARD